MANEKPKLRSVTVLREEVILFEELKRGDLFFVHPASEGDCVDSTELCIAQSDAKPEKPIEFNSGISAEPLNKVGMQIHNTTCDVERRLVELRSKPQQLDNQEFKKLALRTEPDNYKEIYFKRLEKLEVLFALNTQLWKVHQALEDLDKLKKHVFYGKEAESLLNQSKLRIIELQKNEKMHSVLDRIAHSGTFFMTEKYIRLLHGAVGMATESGEMIEQLLSVMSGKPADVPNIMEEISDSNWYSAVIADAFNFTIDDANSRVIEKLKLRFPDCFTESDAINRDIEKERQVLEHNA